MSNGVMLGAVGGSATLKRPLAASAVVFSQNPGGVFAAAMCTVTAAPAAAVPHSSPG